MLKINGKNLKKIVTIHSVNKPIRNFRTSALKKGLNRGILGMIISLCLGVSLFSQANIFLHSLNDNIAQSVSTVYLVKFLNRSCLSVFAWGYWYVFPPQSKEKLVFMERYTLNFVLLPMGVGYRLIKFCKYRHYIQT